MGCRLKTMRMVKKLYKTSPAARYLGKLWAAVWPAMTFLEEFSIQYQQFQLLQVSTLLLLDFTATTVVSAATTASYISGEVTLPFPAFVIAIFYLVLVGVIPLSGAKGSSRIAIGMLMLHLTTMAVLAVAGFIAWGRTGSSQLRENWVAGQAPSATAIIHEVFNGVCLGMLGLTGFEDVPAYISHIKPGRFPLVLRNLHIPAIVINTVIMLLTLAILPLHIVSSFLFVVARRLVLKPAPQVAGPWLRILVVTDAIIVLCGVGLAGIFSACEMLEQLAHDRIIPKVFLKTLPRTGAHYVAVLAFIVLSGIIYASSGASLVVVSKMFTLAWLFVIMLFPISLLLLKFNRGRLPRMPQTSLRLVLSAVATGVAIIAGSIAIDPRTAGYFAAYFAAVLLIIWSTQNKAGVIRWLYWAYDQSPSLHKWRLTSGWGGRLTRLMTRLRKQDVCVLAKSDERQINYLFRMVHYVRQNEETSCLKIVHFVGDSGKAGTPAELEANAKSKFHPSSTCIALSDYARHLSPG
ncbi:hypothetical protein HWV62_41454 [Athelia sp. TMB]|nr:hypothetical protein HWV62_41454 [Athelia sp. TMB]